MQSLLAASVSSLERRGCKLRQAPRITASPCLECVSGSQVSITGHLKHESCALVGETSRSPEDRPQHQGTVLQTAPANFDSTLSPRRGPPPASGAVLGGSHSSQHGWVGPAATARQRGSPARTLRPRLLTGLWQAQGSVPTQSGGLSPLLRVLGGL